jgi:Transglycosylase-like domain
VRTTAIALPAAAVLAGTALAVAPMTAASAETTTPPPSAAQLRAAKVNHLPVKQAHIRHYHLGGHELKQIAKSKKWAKSAKSRSVIRCESGFDYRMIDGPYHGAWQFLTGTWLGAGGGRYAHNADKAPKFAQDYVAWKLWKGSGWGPWSCA